MKTVINHSIYSEQPWHTLFDASYQTCLPVYMQWTYTIAIEKYGIPIEPEFKTSRQSTINKVNKAS